MKFGFVLPFGEAREGAELAQAAEQAGWDAFFVWEPVWGVDAWVTLTAAAMLTSRIRLGTMISPLSRMRPWDLAAKAATLDRLSGGRVILSVGLGAPETGFAAFGEVTDRKTRAELLDEGLEIITGLWAGQPFTFEGRHYHLLPTEFMPPPPPLQQPRIPIWVVGAWPAEKSLGRALRYDGILPAAVDVDPQGKKHPRQANLAELTQIAAAAAGKRTSATPFDIIVEGITPGADPQAAANIVRPWRDAGATWWIEALWSDGSSSDLEPVRRRILQGPPAQP